MTKKGSQLDFISWILRDGSGTVPVSRGDSAKPSDENYFELTCLSLTNKTFVATDKSNHYVVRLKEIKEGMTPYAKAWTEYIGSKEYVATHNTLSRAGIRDPYLTNMLQSAFNAGWNSK